MLSSYHLNPATGAGNMAALAGTVSALALVFVFQRALGLPVSEFGLRRPSSWPRTLLLAAAVALVGGALVQSVMTWLVNPLLAVPPPDVSRFEGVRGNLQMLLVSVPTVWLTSAFPEEVIWRGYLMSRLAGLAGGSRSAWAMALAVTSVHFGLIHFYQGTAGIVATGLTGFLFGAAFLVFGRNLWIPILAHGLVHLMSFTAMYLGRV